MLPLEPAVADYPDGSLNAIGPCSHGWCVRNKITISYYYQLNMAGKAKIFEVMQRSLVINDNDFLGNRNSASKNGNKTIAK
jgi:hypothetical protein